MLVMRSLEPRPEIFELFELLMKSLPLIVSPDTALRRRICDHCCGTVPELLDILVWFWEPEASISSSSASKMSGNVPFPVPLLAFETNTSSQEARH
jgi:hypothetical protein